ncbi:hypothetical protein CQW23_17084 [Capsicum baccatum]|uniref:MATH domain-containing protein n=1 Tax=Capsicum baccatum TaxID=33114 RepID=A0A2G2WD11_CAPBA|nr:hypothetical protein CQW23_17084 [Capsicum baccatum]
MGTIRIVISVATSKGWDIFHMDVSNVFLQGDLYEKVHMSLPQEVTVEVREASPAHHLLKIESFSLPSESGINKIESNEFEAGGYKWKMIIYPDGNTLENGSGHISTDFSLSGTNSLPSGKMQCFQPVKSLWGFPKFLPHKTFNDASNGNLVDDKCAFGAEIWKLLLYPKGNAKNKGCYISIYLYSAKDFDDHQKMKANCSINLRDQINGESKNRSYRFPSLERSVLFLLQYFDVLNFTARCELCGECASFNLRETEERMMELIARAKVYIPMCHKHYVSRQVVKEAVKSVLES